MKVVATERGLRELVGPQRRADRTIGFVPTMGALHEGHLSLIDAARAANDVVVLSIFVNPLQFGPNEDLAKYPRQTKADLRLAEERGVDVVFLPEVEEMYPEGATVTVSVGPMGDLLEGASRPGHFDGVATVVAKLFNQVEPDRAYFGEKDAQQVAVVRRLVQDLSFDVEVIVCPIVREDDGLAKSSRNVYLRGDARTAATALYRALVAGREELEAGGDPTSAEKKMLEVLSADPRIDPDYARVVDPLSFEEPAGGGPVLLVVAARVGATRLIDNFLLEGV